MTAAKVARTWYSAESQNIETPKEKLSGLHKRIICKHGSMAEELPEQLMAVEHLEPTATVLELGGNIGRSSMIISSILNDDSRLVTLESFESNSRKLEENRDINGFNFHIVNAAISDVPMMQNQRWKSKPQPSSGLPKGWTTIPTISWSQLRSRFSNHQFDTLVCDCEGALRKILEENADFLNGIKTVIIENDFSQGDKEYVDSVFRQNGLEVVLSMPLVEKPHQPYASCFYQVWKKV